MTSVDTEMDQGGVRAVQGDQYTSMTNIWAHRSPSCAKHHKTTERQASLVVTVKEEPEWSENDREKLPTMTGFHLDLFYDL